MKLSAPIAVMILYAECLHGNEFIQVCHFPAWGRERNNIAKFDVDDVNPALCSHLVYAYSLIDLIKTTIRPIKPSVEEGSNGKFREFNNLKRQFPYLKTLLQIRAQSSRGEEFFAITSNEETLKQFCFNVLEYLRQWDFDGISLDWRYSPPRTRSRRDRDDDSDEDSNSDERRYTTTRRPTTRDRSSEEVYDASPYTTMKEQFPKLVTCLRSSFDQDTETPRLLLTVLGPVSPQQIDGGFNVKEIANQVDFVYLRTFDFSQPGDRYVNFRSPLFASWELQEHPNLHINYTLGYWKQRGLPYNMMVPGVSGIAARHVLERPSSHRPGSRATGVKMKGKYYDEIGGLAYPEVCQMLSDLSAKQYFSKEQMTPYLVLGDNWVGYEDDASLKWKANWMKEQGVGGILFNYMDEDDFTGTMCEAGRYPLLTALNPEELDFKKERWSSGADAPGWFVTYPLWNGLEATPTKACGWTLLMTIYVAVCCVFHV